MLHRGYGTRLLMRGWVYRLRGGCYSSVKESGKAGRNRTITDKENKLPNLAPSACGGGDCSFIKDLSNPLRYNPAFGTTPPSTPSTYSSSISRHDHRFIKTLDSCPHLYVFFYGLPVSCFGATDWFLALPIQSGACCEPRHDRFEERLF